MLYLQILPIGDTGAATKREMIETILGWMPQPAQLPADLSEVLDGGVASYGAGVAQRDRYVKYLCRFAVAWKEAPEATRTSALADPWSFREFVYEEVGGPR